MSEQIQLSPQDIQRLADEFLMRVEKPFVKPQYQFILGVIGLIGSGKSLAAERLAQRIRGSIVMQSDDVRYIISQESERTGMQIDWGENVTKILMTAAEQRLKEGYSIIFAGHTSNQEDRDAIYDLGDALDLPIRFVFISIDPQTAKDRLAAKYNDPSWVSGFGSFRVRTLEEMFEAIDQRAQIYQELSNADITGFLAEIDNNGSQEDFFAKLDALQIP